MEDENQNCQVHGFSAKNQIIESSLKPLKILKNDIEIFTYSIKGSDYR